MSRHPGLNAFILLFLVFQLAVPLTYYVRDDPYDERFAWRMFSGIRLQTCEPHAFREDDSGKELGITLTKAIHVAWINMMKRNRPAVIRAFLENQCEQAGVRRARLVNHCTAIDGEPLPPREISLDCTSGQLTKPAGNDAPATSGAP